MFVIFGGIAMFTLITQQVLSFRHEDTVDDLVAANTGELSDFLFTLSQTRNNISLHEEVYEDCTTIIEQSLRYSTRATFEDYPYWAMLSP